MGYSSIRSLVVGDIWTNSKIYENTEYVVDYIGNRFMGTESERKAKDHILGLFESYGLENAHEETFNYIGWKRGSCNVEMITPIQRQILCFAHPHSASTPAGGIEAEVIDVGKGVKQDFDRVGDRVKGKIVLATTGWLPGQTYFHGHRAVKHGLTSDFGGVGLIIMNETSGGLIETGTVGTGYRSTGEVPSIGVSFETGAFIQRQLRKGPVKIRMELHNEVVPNTVGWNIVGDIIGSRNPERKVLVGGHFDGHDIGQEAASDNLLGVMVMLDVGRVLAKFKGKFKRTIRFVAFGNEECWSVGSTNYVAQHEDDIRNVDIMINGDSLGRSPNPFVSVSNPPELVSAMIKLVEEARIDTYVGMADPLNPGWCSTSDNHPFIMKGVPTFSLSGRNQAGIVGTAGRGAALRDHTICDTMDKIDRNLIKQSAGLLAELLMALADRNETVVRQSTREEVLKAIERYGYIDVLKAQRRWHPDSVLGSSNLV